MIGVPDGLVARINIERVYTPLTSVTLYCESVITSKFDYLRKSFARTRLQTTSDNCSNITKTFFVVMICSVLLFPL